MRAHPSPGPSRKWCGGTLIFSLTGKKKKSFVFLCERRKVCEEMFDDRMLQLCCKEAFIVRPVFHLMYMTQLKPIDRRISRIHQFLESSFWLIGLCPCWLSFVAWGHRRPRRRVYSVRCDHCVEPEKARLARRLRIGSRVCGIPKNIISWSSFFDVLLSSRSCFVFFFLFSRWNFSSVRVLVMEACVFEHEFEKIKRPIFVSKKGQISIFLTYIMVNSESYGVLLSLK